MKKVFILTLAILFAMQGRGQVTVPHDQNFEGSTSEWQFTSSSSPLEIETNKWVIGSAAGNPGKSLYVGNDTANTYSVSVSMPLPIFTFITHPSAYFLVNLGNEPEHELSFDWRANGELGRDFMRVYLVPSSYTLPKTGFPSGAGVLQLSQDYMNLQTTWGRDTFCIPGNYSGTTQKIAFYWNNRTIDMTDPIGMLTVVANNPAAAVDNVSIRSLTCGRPYNIEADNITATTANITWEQGGSAAIWRLYWSAVGSGVVDSIDVTTNSHQLTNLSDGTRYNVWIKTDCGSDGFSNAATYSFSTPCLPSNNLPYNESFDDGYVGTAHNAAGVVPDCWKSYVNGTAYPAPHIAASGNWGWYPSSPPNCLSFITSSSATSAYAVLPAFQRPIRNLNISFMYRYEDAAQGTLTVGYITGNQDNYSSYVPVETVPAVATLSTFTNNNSLWGAVPVGATHIAIRWFCNNAEEYFTCSVDDIIVSAAACPTPGNVRASGVTSNSANILWDAGNASTWELEYGVGGNYTTLVPSVTTQPHSLQGLQPSTTYNVRMRAVCGSEYSSYNTCSFTTLETPCNTPANLTEIAKTDTSITVTWVPTSGENEWKIIYSGGGTSGQIAGILNYPYTLISLQRNTTYTICVVAVCAPGVESDPTYCISATTATGIHDLALANSVKLYPNPASDKLMVEMESNFNTIEISNILGQTIYRANITDNQTLIDVAEFSTGMYYVKLQGNSGMVAKKFVKK